MEKRQHPQDAFRAVHAAAPGAELHRVRQQIAVRKHDRLGRRRGAAGGRQHRDIFLWNNVRRQVQRQVAQQRLKAVQVRVFAQPQRPVPPQALDAI